MDKTDGPDAVRIEHLLHSEVPLPPIVPRQTEHSPRATVRKLNALGSGRGSRHWGAAPLAMLVVAAWILAAFVPTRALAQEPTQIDRLYTALGMDQIIEIMRTEGLGYGVDLQADMLGGQGGQRWSEAVSDIYNLDRMGEILKTRLEQELQGVDITPLVTFFESDLGREVIELEVTAREAFLDPDVEAASEADFADRMAENDPKALRIAALADDADLIENNVVGALNSNYAFYAGLVEGGGLPADMTEADILTEVWSQEADIRADTTVWIHAYLNLSYQPLDDDDMETYFTFYVSEDGRVLNRAVFAAFDEMFTVVSFSLGRMIAKFSVGEEL